MKTIDIRITIVVLCFFLAESLAKSQDVGATFCWHYNEIYGGHSYPANQSIAKQKLPDGTHWSVTTEWWENMAEEIEFSGIDFVALLSRGTTPDAPDRGNGNPKHITKLVNAMNLTGATFKLCIFDDCPNSWTGAKNWNESGGAVYSTDNPKFDCSVTANWQYIYDYNIKPTIEAIPDAKRYKIDGRMVIWFWGAKPSWMTNLQGNLSRILTHIKTRCQADFGFTPYLIIEKSWLDNDNTITTTHADGVHGWFSSAGGVSYTLTSWNGRKFGALCPGIRTSDRPDYIDPAMGTSDNSLRLKTGLENTVGAGARTTLVEGFTDAAENAALWRSNDGEYYNYPNQRLNALRHYSKDPYPSILKMEVEACDQYHDLTSGNSGGAFLYSGDLDVLKCDDIYGGWYVTSTQSGEWMEWKELPLLVNTKFLLRYKSTTLSSIKFSVDGIDLSTINLPSTNGAWSTIDAGEYRAATNGLHTVRLTVVSGAPSLNYFTRVVNGTFAVTGVDVTPALGTIPVGGAIQLSAQVLPIEASNRTVYWSTSNPLVAKVSENGLVTAFAEGSAVITATTQDGGKTDESIISVIASTAETLILQAEDAVYEGAIVNTNQDGYHGTGFIDFVNSIGDYIEWNVDVANAGVYSFSFRYALPNGGRPLELKVNGEVKVASLDFPGTGDWATWGSVTTSQVLNAGKNKIKLSTKGSNGGNIDELTVVYKQASTGFHDLENEKVQSVNIYPNPYHQGRLSIDLIGFENLSHIRLKIINLMGRTVYEELLNDNSHADLNLSGVLNESIYIISIESSGSSVVRKLIVK
ncbi:MAG: DUF5010 domain-containing protein [Bacteroidales bacterium]|nr:DUF5010 domain-containing protein [Bacteroidales bacterium]